MKFLGPRKHAIEVMGDKKNSRIVAEEAGVNQIPGDNTIIQSPEHALEIAHKYGYPVMIKAVHGGGGKGMRAAYSDEELVEAYHICKGEAKAFGNLDLMVRKYLDGSPRHIEIQVRAGPLPFSFNPVPPTPPLRLERFLQARASFLPKIFWGDNDFGRPKMPHFFLTGCFDDPRS